MHVKQSLVSQHLKDLLLLLFELRILLQLLPRQSGQDLVLLFLRQQLEKLYLGLHFLQGLERVQPKWLQLDLSLGFLELVLGRGALGLFELKVV
jgi:hypothetical protein